jgi:hypothetical protein
VHLSSADDCHELRRNSRPLTIDEVAAGSPTAPDELVIGVSVRSVGSAFAVFGVGLVGQDHDIERVLRERQDVDRKILGRRPLS